MISTVLRPCLSHAASGNEKTTKKLKVKLECSFDIYNSPIPHSVMGRMYSRYSLASASMPVKTPPDTKPFRIVRLQYKKLDNHHGFGRYRHHQACCCGEEVLKLRDKSYYSETSCASNRCCFGRAVAGVLSGTRFRQYTDAGDDALNNGLAKSTVRSTIW